MVAATDAYAGVVRITRAGFARVLAAGANPDVLRERPAEEYYDTILTFKTPDGRVLDPLFILAMFNHESSMGKAGVAVTTHSWGNTRLPAFGPSPLRNPDGSIKQTPGRTGSFPIYPDWLTGLQSTCARLTTGEWYYAYERRTLGQVFNDPVADNPAHTPAMAPAPRERNAAGQLIRIEWAPAGDLNNPAGYLRAMLDFMNAHQDIDGTGGTVPEQRLFDMFSHTPTIDRSQVLTNKQIAQLPNFPHGNLRQFKYITIHDTGNPAVTADAQMHRNFVANGGGSGRVSFQWTVDDDSIIQITPKLTACWHAGDDDGPGNWESNAIETCINGDYFRTLYNTAYLVATLQIEDGVKLANKVQHNRWSGKDCPMVIRKQGLWEWFLQGVEAWKEHLTAPDTPLERSFADVNVPYVLKGVMKEHFEWLEDIPAGDTQLVWLTLGYPTENETIRNIDGVDRLTQTFQRGMLINEPENLWPWNIHHAMLDQLEQISAPSEIEQRYHLLNHHVRRSYEIVTKPLEEL